MENLNKPPKLVFSPKKNVLRSQQTIQTSDSYFKTHLYQGQKRLQHRKEDIHFTDKISLFRKYADSYKFTPKRIYDYLQTSKSVIVPSKQHRFCQSYDLIDKFGTSNKIPYKRSDIDSNNASNYLKKKHSNPINSHMDKFLQMAKKQKQRSIPAYSLMFTPKVSKFSQKDEPFIIQQLRQTEDTIPENDDIYRPNPPKASDFHQVKLLGKGKNGEVYLAIHKATGFACAMKIIKKSDINKGTPAQKQILYNQLLRQIKVQLFLSHPNIIELYCVFSDKENIYLIQQLGIDGQLYDLMKKKFRFSEQSTALIARQILRGLKSMHEKQIIHRDIKPQNIVAIYGIAKLCDFGWSVYCPLELRSTLCGTPLYLSPEVLIGEQYNEKIDIWAYGTLIYELFTGDNPFKIKNKCDLKKIVTEELDFAHNFPRRLRSFLECILKKKSSERPTAKELEKHQFLKKYAELQTSQQLATL